MTSQKLFRLLLIAPLLAISFNYVQAQGRGVNGDRARAIEQADMDRILMFAIPRDKESEAVRLNRFKKIKEDFRDLQSFNNKMMADAWMQEALDYSAIADMVSKIRGRASSLKGSLTLPEPEKADASMPVVTTVRQFREELLLLDKTLMRFVNNPVFQAANSVDLNQAKNARQDLDRVILLTDDVKQNAQKLKKAAH
jgi:hypothetical protein